MKAIEHYLMGLRPALDRLRYEMRTVALRYARSRQPVVIACAPAPARLGIADQWSRVSGILGEGQNKAFTIVLCQNEASAQLDAATYALQRLRDEIAPALMGAGGPAGQILATPTKGFRQQPFRRREPIAA